MSTTLIGFDLTAVYSALTPSGSGLQAPKLGQVYEDGVGKKYKFVKNNHSSALTVGDVVCYTYANAVNTDVIRPTTATLNFMAGVAVGAIPVSGFGWIQVKGVNDATNLDGTTDIAIGDSLKAVNGTLAAVKDAAAGTTPSFQNYLIALEAFTDNSAAATNSVLICCEGGI